MEYLSSVLFGIIWTTIGIVLTNRFCAMFSFAMHKKYTLASPAVGRRDEPFALRSLGALMGPLSLVIFPLSFIGFDIEWSWRAFFCKPGQVYFKNTGYPDFKSVEVK